MGFFHKTIPHAAWKRSSCIQCTGRISKHTSAFALETALFQNTCLSVKTLISNLSEGLSRDRSETLENKIFFVFKVVIYKFFSSLWATGHQYYIISFICHILVVHGTYKLVSSEDVTSYLSGCLQRPLIPPTHRLYLYIYTSPSSLFLSNKCIYAGESAFPLSQLLSIHTHTHTPIHCLLPLPPAPPISFSLPLSCSVCFASAQ